MFFSCVFFFVNLGLHWAFHGMGSYAIRPRLRSPNTLFMFCAFLKKGTLKSPTWVSFWVIFEHKCDFWVKKGVPKTASKKGAQPESNETLFTGREAPGEAASRARCSDKKQLFEQQLKHCSRFLQKKVDWAQNLCKKLNGMLDNCNKIWMDCWKLLTVAFF